MTERSTEIEPTTAPDRCPSCGGDLVPSAAFAGVQRCDACGFIGTPDGTCVAAD